MKTTVLIALAAAFALTACQKETPVVVEPAQTPVVVTTPPADVTVVTPPAAEAPAPVEVPAEEKK